MNQWDSAPKGDGCTRVEAGGGWVERGEREIEERKREKEKEGENTINDETKTHEGNARGKKRRRRRKRNGRVTEAYSKRNE